MYRVRYLPLGVKNIQQKIIYISLQDVKDYGMVDASARMLGCLVSDIKSVECIDE